MKNLIDSLVFNGFYGNSSDIINDIREKREREAVSAVSLTIVVL